MSHPKLKMLFVGVDTHRRTHTVTIINCFSEKLAEITFDNKPAAFPDFLDEVAKHVKKGQKISFGLEDTGAAGRALAAFLIGRKKTVKSVNSTLSYSERRNQPITEKSDGYDSFCVARVLLNKYDELPNAIPNDTYWALKTLISRRNAVVRSMVIIKNQFHAYIIPHYPSYRSFFTSHFCQTALAFWEKYPSQAALKGVGIEEMGDFLKDKSSGFFGEDKAAQILKLVEADGDTTSNDCQDSRDFMIRTCVRELKHHMEELDTLESEIKKIMSRLSYKLETLIGVDIITAAGLVAEIGDIGRFKNSASLAKYSGIAPVNYSSGEKDRRFKSRQGNRQLYTIIHNIAARNISCGRNKDRPVNGIFYAYYQKKISEGKTTSQAIILVMRRLVNIIYGMMKNKTEYIHPFQ